MGLERSDPRLSRWLGIQPSTVEINGHKVYRWSPRGSTQMSVTLTQGVLALLKIGTNKFGIRATRAGLPHSFHQCNSRGHQAVIAISAEFNFSFDADLRVAGLRRHPDHLAVTDLQRGQQTLRSVTG